MSQHDFIISNQGFPAFRSDLNDGLQALASLSSGATAPSTTYANQLWYDTANDILKIRNEDNDAWISIVTFNQTTDAVSSFANTPSLTGSNTLSGTNTFSGTMVASGNAYMSIDTLTDASTIAVDMSVGNNFSVTLGDVALDPLTYATIGASIPASAAIKGGTAVTKAAVREGAEALARGAARETAEQAAEVSLRKLLGTKTLATAEGRRSLAGLAARMGSSDELVKNIAAEGRRAFRTSAEGVELAKKIVWICITNK